MTKIIVWNLITLNGFFNGAEDWQIEWHNQVWGEEIQKYSITQMQEVDTLIFGRKTYEGMASYWQTAEGEGEVTELMNSVPKIVFSKTLETATWNNTQLVREDAVTYFQQILKTKTNSKGKMFIFGIFGSADLIASLHKAKLIDEYRLCICPIVLGKGMPMFKQSDFDMELTLTKAEVLQSGGVIMWLTPKSR